MSSIGASSETCAAKTSRRGCGDRPPDESWSRARYALGDGGAGAHGNPRGNDANRTSCVEDRRRHHDGNHQIAPRSELAGIASATRSRRGMSSAVTISSGRAGRRPIAADEPLESEHAAGRLARRARPLRRARAGMECRRPPARRCRRCRRACRGSAPEPRRSRGPPPGIRRTAAASGAPKSLQVARRQAGSDFLPPKYRAIHLVALISSTSRRCACRPSRAGRRLGWVDIRPTGEHVTLARRDRQRFVKRARRNSRIIPALLLRRPLRPVGARPGHQCRSPQGVRATPKVRSSRAADVAPRSAPAPDRVGIAITPAARRHYLDPVPGREPDLLILRKVLGDQGRARAVDAHNIRRAVHAAPHAGRAEAAVVHDEGGARFAAQQLHLVVDAEAAAVPRPRRPSLRAAQSGGRAQDSTAPSPRPAPSLRCRSSSTRWSGRHAPRCRHSRRR